MNTFIIFIFIVVIIIIVVIVIVIPEDLKICSFLWSF